LKNDVNVLAKSIKLKKLKKVIFCGNLELEGHRAGSGSGSGTIIVIGTIHESVK
jgi:hypothetical protein